jgi:hypothetical protein
MRHRLLFPSARRTLVLLAMVLASVALVPADRADAFSIGFYDTTFASSDAAARNLALDRAAQERSTWVRVPIRWSGVAPSNISAGFDPTNPADPAYRWAAIDAGVTDAAVRGLKVMLTLNGAPIWAQGDDRPAKAPSGAWKPDPAAFGQFALAVARRYSGSFVPAGSATPLPRVTAFQAWNEPNLNLYLSPQWVKSGGNYEEFAPTRYREMLNAFAQSVRSVHNDNLVVTAGTGPFGDPDPGGNRIRPVLFWRYVFCLSESLKAKTCKQPADLDVVSHHPYGVGGPLQSAISPLDAAAPDMGRIGTVLKAAVRLRSVTARRATLWVTEIGWDTKPPDPNGVQIDKQARWLEQSFYVLWRSGVSNVLWYLVMDQPPVPSYEATQQTGVFLMNGVAKPAAQTFAFPFVVDRTRDGVWGIAPSRGTVQLQRQVKGKWRTVATATAGSDRVFFKRVTHANVAWRAVQGIAASLYWGRSSDGL